MLPYKASVTLETPYDSPVPSMATTNVWCLLIDIEKKPIGYVFPIGVSSTDTVAHLKRKVAQLEENPVLFNHARIIVPLLLV